MCLDFFNIDFYNFILNSNIFFLIDPLCIER